MLTNSLITLVFNIRMIIICSTIFLSACDSPPTIFKKVSSEESGIHFTNTVTENDSINPLDLEFLYNGGGVGVGDFNNDGLADLYFTASIVSNKLYLNKGNFRFEDITEEATVDGKGRWCNGVSVVDINNDGFEDIYVCATINKNPDMRKNLLYINQGLNQKGNPTFKEMAQQYNLDDTSYSVQAAFLDYDNDGDLDMYLATTKLASRNASSFSGNNEGDFYYADIDKLFRNDWSDSLNHPIFSDVSVAAGIKETGFGLGVAIADLNKDGWKDIYVTNDFYSDDLLYINNKNGTFTNELNTYFKHTSQNAMGNDISDINNDGLADIIAVDMNPEDNYRKKKNMGSNNYFIYQSMIYRKKSIQYVRNTLQLNRGPSVGSNDSIQHPVFSDIGFYAGVAETDWSWNTGIADFDNDGYRDIAITNGYPKDVTDRDFIAFRDNSIATKQQLLNQIPKIKIPNYIYKNSGNLTFENVTDTWGMTEPSFSNGAVYVDLDNDGDLDYVVNNINDKAFVYKNTLENNSPNRPNYLQVKLKGENNNRYGIGTWVEIYYNQGRQQVYENSPYRGYLSTVDTKINFGLGNNKIIDSLIIRWPGGKKQKLVNVPSNQMLVVDIKNATLPDSWERTIKNTTSLLVEITTLSGVSYIHNQPDYIDFNHERLLPHKLSQYGPGLAAGDIDGNGLDDFFVGGTAQSTGNIFLQQASGKFVTKALRLNLLTSINQSDNLGVLLFDAENDGDLDLYCASGSNQYPANTINYQDIFYKNDGKGNFTQAKNAIPINYTSKSCIKAADFDNDGDLDLFVGGRILPAKYPFPVSSFIYRNDSKKGRIKFTDITNNVAKDLNNIGLVSDAIWTDFDNDNFIDLVIAGEWMPITFLKNNKGKFENITGQSGISQHTGWWNSITSGDFDNDGDMDYVAGNFGENSFYRPTDEHPISIYAKDFDNNKTYEAIPTVFLKNKNGQYDEFTAHNRDDIVEQLPYLKKKFLKYTEFADAGIHKLFTEDQLKDALKLKANFFKSAFVRNNGNGKFEIQLLPNLAQLSPVYGMVVDDLNGDGYLDITLSGNDYGTEVGTGRCDAFYGLALLGDGKGNFQQQSILQSGFFLPGDAKALIKIKGPNNSVLIVASQNRGPLKLFKRKSASEKLITYKAGDRYILITLTNGQVRKEELYYGSSFLSQSSNFLSINKNIRNIEIHNTKGEKREIDFDIDH